ncbi:MAG: AmmeMemoRadiSam system protein B [Halobellus sp.]
MKDDPPDSGGPPSHDDGGGTEPVAAGGRPTGGERDPAVAGRFYARSEDELREQIEECLHHEYGPGVADGDGDDLPHAVVSPHAGYPFSGPVAAHAFVTLAAEDVDTAVVIGPNHEGIGTAAAVAPHDRWRTPLGTVPIDDDLATTFVEDSDVARFDGKTHAGEHSIEVQLPFLQHCLDDVTVVPVCLTRLGRDRAEQLGRDIAGAIERIDREAVVVSSTDLTHYEPHERAVSADEPVIEAIEALDVDSIERAVTEEGHSMCGPWATVAGLVAARERGATEGERLQYVTSGQTEGRRDQVVGYCSAALY